MVFDSSVKSWGGRKMLKYLYREPILLELRCPFDMIHEKETRGRSSFLYPKNGSCHSAPCRTPCRPLNLLSRAIVLPSNALDVRSY